MQKMYKIAVEIWKKSVKIREEMNKIDIFVEY